MYWAKIIAQYLFSRTPTPITDTDIKFFEGSPLPLGNGTIPKDGT